TGTCDVQRRVDLPAILADFEMHVITRGAPRAADPGDGLATLHQITDLHDVALVVRVQRDVAIGVTDFHGIAVTVLLAGESHHPGRHGDHITARLGCEVHPFVHTGTAGQRMHAAPEWRGHISLQ